MSREFVFMGYALLGVAVSIDPRKSEVKQVYFGGYSDGETLAGRLFRKARSANVPATLDPVLSESDIT